jgi:hypothetical protein
VRNIQNPSAQNAETVAVKVGGTLRYHSALKRVTPSRLDLLEVRNFGVHSRCNGSFFRASFVKNFYMWRWGWQYDGEALRKTTYILCDPVNGNLKCVLLGDGKSEWGRSLLHGTSTVLLCVYGGGFTCCIVEQELGHQGPRDGFSVRRYL